MADSESKSSLPTDTRRETRAPSSVGPSYRFRPRSVSICLLLFVIVVWAFFPATSNEFLRFDDGAFVTANAQVQGGLSWNNVIWAFCNPVAANWHPLTVLSHMLDCQLYGLKPWGHHLTSVLLHAANAVLLFLVFRQMAGAFWRSLVLAGLFALHPLRVESVAWVAERKDVLSAFFFLITLWAYGRHVKGRAEKPGSQECKPENRSKRHNSMVFYSLALVFFAFGLMCKPMLVTLPFVLLLLDYWPLHRFHRDGQGSGFHSLVSLLPEKLPFLALAAISGVITLVVQNNFEAIATDMSFETRLSNALVSYVRYVSKIFWPEDLAVFYPHPRQWPEWQVLGAAALLLIILAAAIMLARRRRYVTCGWLWFCGTLLPVIGLIQVGNQSMADRYTYLPAIGLMFMLIWTAGDLTLRWRYWKMALASAAIVASLFCIDLTRRQITRWKDDASLWQHTLAVTKNNDFAHVQLGIALAHQGQFDEAIAHFGEAIRLSPQDVFPRLNLAYALTKRGRFTEAIQQYEAVLRLNPADVGAHNDLGLTLVRKGRVDEAIRHFAEALRLKPDFAEVHYNLGLALAKRGDLKMAVVHFREVLRLKPDDSKARQKLAQVLAAQQNIE